MPDPAGSVPPSSHDIRPDDPLQNLASFLEHHPLATFAIDSSGSVVFWNREIARLTGIPPSGVLGRSDHVYAVPFYGTPRNMLIDYAASPGLWCDPGHYSRFQREGDLVIGETRVTMPDGTVRHLSGVASPVFDGSGVRIGAIETVIDHREPWCREVPGGEAAGSLAPVFYRSIFESIHEAVFVKDPQNRFIFLNKAARDLIRDGKDTGDPVKLTEAEHQEMNRIGLPGMSSLLTLGEHDGREDARVTCTERDMHYHDYGYLNGTLACIDLYRAAVRDDEGRVLGTVGIARNISSEKVRESLIQEKEERSSTIIAHLSAGICVSDRDGVIIEWNNRCRDITGHESHSTLGRRVWEIWANMKDPNPGSGQSVQDARNWFSGMLSNPLPEQGFYEAETTLAHYDGKKRILLVRSTPLETLSGQVLCNEVYDVTREREVEMDLRESTRKLELLTGVTRHDILNQLTTLSGFIELARHCSDEAELQDVIRHQEEIIRRIEEHILFSRNYQSIGNSSPQWQSLSRVMERISDGMIETEGIIFTSVGTVEVFADPLLPKVFFNIIENSFRHGGAVSRIDIRCEKTPEGCTITFEDDGCGVSAGEKDLIFRQGYGKNTGLGLFLSREILRITDIRIRETGIPGKGARFELNVPACNTRDPGPKP